MAARLASIAVQCGKVVKLAVQFGKVCITCCIYHVRNQAHVIKAAAHLAYRLEPKVAVIAHQSFMPVICSMQPGGQQSRWGVMKWQHNGTAAAGIQLYCTGVHSHCDFVSQYPVRLSKAARRHAMDR